MERNKDLEALGVRLADEVKTTVIRPRDTLVIAMRRRVTMDEHHEMMDYIREFLPGVKVLVVPEAGDILVFRPDGEGM